MVVISTFGMDIIEAAYAIIKTNQVPQQWYNFLVELAKPNGSSKRLQTWVGLQVIQGDLHLVKCHQMDEHRIGRIRTFPSQWDSTTSIPVVCGVIRGEKMFRLQYNLMGTWKEIYLPKPESNQESESLPGEVELYLNIVAEMVLEMCNNTRFRKRMNWI